MRSSDAWAIQMSGRPSFRRRAPAQRSDDWRRTSPVASAKYALMVFPELGQRHLLHNDLAPRAAGRWPRTRPSSSPGPAPDLGRSFSYSNFAATFIGAPITPLEAEPRRLSTASRRGVGERRQGRAPRSSASSMYFLRLFGAKFSMQWWSALRSILEGPPPMFGGLQQKTPSTRERCSCKNRDWPPRAGWLRVPDLPWRFGPYVVDQVKTRRDRNHESASASS